MELKLADIAITLASRRQKEKYKDQTVKLSVNSIHVRLIVLIISSKDK